MPILIFGYNLTKFSMTPIYCIIKKFLQAGPQRMKTILIIEDESAIRDMIQFALTPAGFNVQEAGDIKQAEKYLALRHPDLILLDWMLPDQSGIAYSRKLKSHSQLQHIPIIMLTAKAEEENKVRGLEAGVDDYITKPFSPRELIARINTVLRRGPLISRAGLINCQALSLDVNTHTLKIKNEIVPLTPIEYKLLHFFMKHPARVYNRAELLDYIWTHDRIVDERTVDVQIRRLRKRLQPYHYDHYIKTIRGSGYLFTLKKT